MYHRGQSILIIGDSNFSFSMALAQKLEPLENHFVVASKDSLAFALTTYKTAHANLKKLKKVRGCSTVYYRVDPAHLSKQFPSRWSHSFDRIIWNFPMFSPSSILANQLNLSNFLGSAAALLRPSGEIHLRLCNFQPVYWRVHEILRNGPLKILGTEPFHSEDYPGYDRVCDFKDEDWELYPFSALTYRIGARGETISEEETTKRLFRLNLDLYAASFHSECQGNKKRKLDSQEIEGKTMISTGDPKPSEPQALHIYHHFQFQQQQPQVNSSPLPINPYVPFFQQMYPRGF